MQNFASAAVGIAVVVALVRGLARSEASRVGNFWVDLVRTVTRVLLPGALVGAVLLVVGGVVQNLASPTEVTGVTGAKQTILGGLVASQEAIKELGTNGGGFFNANSAHPFENPNAATNLLEIFLILVIPFALCRMYGVLVGDRRQGWPCCPSWGSSGRQRRARHLVRGPRGRWPHRRHGGQGDPLRHLASALFGASTTATSTGAVNSMHDSYSAAGGGASCCST